MITEAVKEETNVQTRRKLGVVAGLGNLPPILAQSAIDQGYDVVAFALTEECEALIKPYAVKTHLIAAGQLGRNVKLMQKEGLKEVVFIGKTPKLDYLIRQWHKLDWTAIMRLSKLPNFNDDTIQFAVGDLCEENGVKVLAQSQFLRHIFANAGVITKRKPSPEEYADVEYGMGIAKEIARLDIGQTVIVKDRMVLAIEAIEGTDEAIKRAVLMKRGPVVVCKVSKPDQDQRFDIPTVGMTTLQSMRAPKPGGVLALEARETMIIDESRMAEWANANGIAIVAV